MRNQTSAAANQLMQQIYLDYNATTPVAEQVSTAIIPFLTDHYGNPSSSHVLGLTCAEALWEAREQLAALLGSDPDEIIFTGSGTESNNLAIKGVMLQPDTTGRIPCEGHLIVTSIEHPAVVEPARYLKRLGLDVSIAKCDRHGVVRPEEIESLIRDDTKLVSVMHANNEIGTLQPIADIAKLCREHDILSHTDAAQSVGKIRVNVEDLDVDLLTVAGHKLYAPKGVGALYVRNGVTISPVLHGAGHEHGLRPGTENVAFIVGLGRAATLANRVLDESAEQMELLRDRLLDLLREVIGLDLTVNGEAVERLPNTLSVNFPGVSGHELLERVPEICASTGAACHSGGAAISATLQAIGLDPQVARGTVRLSVGRNSSEEEIDRAASLLIDAWEKLH